MPARSRMPTRAWLPSPALRPARLSRRCRRNGSRPATRMRAAPSSRASSPNASRIVLPGSRRLSMAGRKAFQYTVLRVVPDVERGERINVGVVVYSPERRFLGARVHVDRDRLGAIAPALDLDALERHLTALVGVAEGADGAVAIAALPQSERF